MKIVSISANRKWTALEFFAGIGLARAGLESSGIHTVWANDYDSQKKEMYEGQWGNGELMMGNIHSMKGEDVPTADIAWSSSPCTDLSLAGKRAGLRGGRESSAFFGFTRVLREMGSRKPSVVVLENVTGLASSHNREDLRAAAKEFNDLGYVVDAITLDARRFIPQSRPRLFLIGAKNPKGGGCQDSCLRPDWLAWLYEDTELQTFMTPLPTAPDLISCGLTSQIEKLPAKDKRWWDEEKVSLFVESMAPVQRDRLNRFVNARKLTARTAYRRTRNGNPVWEMRAEDISG